MTINRGTVFQLFKYAVYSLLAVNVYLFWHEEFLAALVEYPQGVSPGHWVDAYATTIDTAAWLVLLLMFELETYVLEDQQFTPAITRLLHGVRFFAYAFIVYAFYGYLLNALATHDVSLLPGIDQLCALADSGFAYAIDYDEYVAIAAANCAELSSAPEFFRFADLEAIVDAGGLAHIQLLAWADALNALVWILIVVILEIEVRLQERETLTAAMVRTFTAVKLCLYSILFLLAIYWGVDGDFVDFWDAFLWLVAFFFIEMNVLEWREEELAADDPSPLASA